MLILEAKLTPRRCDLTRAVQEQQVWVLTKSFSRW